MTGSDTQTLPRSSVSISLSPFLCAAIYFLPMTRSNPSRANVWQLAWGESSYFGIHITGPLAYVLNSHKTNTFFAVDENKIRARDESEKDLRATLIYMCRNTVCWKKKKRRKTHETQSGRPHILYPSFTHMRTVHAHANSSLSDALWTSIKFRPSCMSAFNKQREVQGRGQEERGMEGRRGGKLRGA